jgi:endonuclease/exonuclease/phosphatase (EEP) superfamily protein YafD
MKVARVLLVALLCVLVGSQLLTDRIGFLQWVWWIPRVFLAAPLVLGCVVLWLGSSGAERRLHGRLAAAAIAAAMFTTWSDWGLPKQRPEGGTRVVFWNVCYAERAEAAPAIEFLLSLDADVMVLTDPGLLFAGGGAELLNQRGYTIATPGRFAVATRIALVEAVPLYATRHRALSRIGLEASGRALVIDAIDLPSETTLHRYPSMRAFAGAIDPLRASPADVTVGDFNITRGSASIGLVVPDTREAFAEAGVGWGGTYSRTRPFLAIDQMMVAETWRAARAEVLDPGLGRHRALVVDLVPAETE